MEDLLAYSKYEQVLCIGILKDILLEIPLTRLLYRIIAEPSFQRR